MSRENKGTRRVFITINTLETPQKKGGKQKSWKKNKKKTDELASRKHQESTTMEKDQQDSLKVQKTNSVILSSSLCTPRAYFHADAKMCAKKKIGEGEAYY